MISKIRLNVLTALALLLCVVAVPALADNMGPYVAFTATKPGNVYDAFSWKLAAPPVIATYNAGQTICVLPADVAGQGDKPLIAKNQWLAFSDNQVPVNVVGGLMLYGTVDRESFERTPNADNLCVPLSASAEQALVASKQAPSNAPAIPPAPSTLAVGYDAKPTQPIEMNDVEDSIDPQLNGASTTLDPSGDVCVVQLTSDRQATVETIGGMTGPAPQNLLAPDSANYVCNSLGVHAPVVVQATPTEKIMQGTTIGVKLVGLGVICLVLVLPFYSPMAAAWVYRKIATYDVIISRTSAWFGGKTNEDHKNFEVNLAVLSIITADIIFVSLGLLRDWPIDDGEYALDVIEISLGGFIGFIFVRLSLGVIRTLTYATAVRPLGKALVKRFPRNLFNLEKYDLFWTAAGWRIILGNWPTHPTSEEDSVKRETQLWKNYARHFTDESKGHPALCQKQEILDYFRNNEMHVLAEYYAATGKYIEPLFGRSHIGEFYNHIPPRLKFRFELGEPQIQEALKKKSDHMAKWGGWFFANIEGAFLGHTVNDAGPTSPVSPVDHPAADDLAY